MVIEQVSDYSILFYQWFGAPGSPFIRVNAPRRPISSTTNASLPGYQSYVDSVEGFSIQYPSDWSIKKDVEGAVISFVSPLESNSDIFQENLNIIVSPKKFESYFDFFRLLMN